MIPLHHLVWEAKWMLAGMLLFSGIIGACLLLWEVGRKKSVIALLFIAASLVVATAAHGQIGELDPSDGGADFTSDDGDTPATDSGFFPVLNTNLAMGTFNTNCPIQHFIFIMMENQSFDGLCGFLNFNTNYFTSSNLVDAVHEVTANDNSSNPQHDWQACHDAFAGGNMSGFGAAVSISPATIPYYYGLFNRFSLCDRYFASALTCSFPNWGYEVAGTSRRRSTNGFDKRKNDFNETTVFHWLTKSQVPWKVYTFQEYKSLGGPKPRIYHNVTSTMPSHFGRIIVNTNNNFLIQNDFETDLNKNVKLDGYHSPDFYMSNAALPAVCWIDAGRGWDDHPPTPFKYGIAVVHSVLSSLMASQYWSDSAVILRWDEAGGNYDHVVPPKALSPDGLPSRQPSNPGFTRLGFRVPAVCISPFARTHTPIGRYNPLLGTNGSHIPGFGMTNEIVMEHCSTLKILEWAFNGPYLTMRDKPGTQFGNDTIGGKTIKGHYYDWSAPFTLSDMTEWFDFAHPNYSTNGCTNLCTTVALPVRTNTVMMDSYPMGLYTRTTNSFVITEMVFTNGVEVPLPTPTLVLKK